MSDLPSGWEWTTIGHVADVQLGRQRSPKNHQGPHMRPYLRAANITWSGIDLSDVKEMNFDPGEASTFELQPGDLLLNEASGSPNEVGKPAIWRGEIDGCCFQNTLLRVRPRRLSTEYLYWYCRAAALSGRFGEAGRGVNIRHLGKQGLSAFPLALPPLSEQERIVAAIEEHLSRLDAAGASLRGARLRITTLRAAVLAEWVADQARAHGLVPLAEKLGPSALFSDGDWVESKDQDPDGGVRLTQLADIGDGYWRNRSARFMRQEQFDRLGCTRLEPRDVLVARMPDPLGRACLFPGDPLPCVTVVDVAIIRPGADGPCPEWLVPVLNSAQTRRQVAALQAGTTRKRISRRNLATVLVPDTPRRLQLNLVGMVEEPTGVAQRTLDAMGLVEARHAALRRSVLAAAFSGRLVLPDPDDEPASMLLDRIRAQRVAVASTKRTQKVNTS